MRSFQLPLFLLALVSLALPAAAQTSVYGAISYANYCYKLPGELYCHPDTGGFTGGATWLFPSSDRLKSGIDARFDGSSGDHGGEAGLVSLRIAYVPRRTPVSPYFQIGGGVVTTVRNSTPPERRTGGVVDFAFGLNILCGPHVFIRPFEIMGTGGSEVAHANIGAGIGYTFGDRHNRR